MPAACACLRRVGVGMSEFKAAPPDGARALVLLTIAAGILTLGACARNSAETEPRKLNQTWSPRVVEEGQPVPRGGGSYKIGLPYQVKGQWYYPKEEPGYDQIGVASWYGPDFHGRKTANGEIYDMNALTAAHPTLPVPSYVRVTNIETGRALLVRINDRGPYANDRIIDLSRQTATLLGFQERGTTRVRVTYAGPAPLDGNVHREMQFLASQPWYRRGYALNGPRNDTTVYKQPFMAAPVLSSAMPAVQRRTVQQGPLGQQGPWGLGAQPRDGATAREPSELAIPGTPAAR